MRHRFAGKQLSRTPSHRKAMRRNMAASLIEHGSIRTTKVKAKELRRFVERLITTARRDTLHARRQVLKMIRNRHAVEPEDRDYTEPWIKKVRKSGRTILDVLFEDVAPRYADRPGGYTRIIRISDRRIGDAGEQVILQLVEESSAEESSGPKRRRRRAAKRHEAAAAVAAAPAASQPADDEPADEAPADEEPPADADQADAPEQDEADAAEESDEK